MITATDMFSDPARKPGNLGFDPLSISTPANRAKYELSEVIHGRAAMMGFSGIIHQVPSSFCLHTNSTHLCHEKMRLLTLSLDD